MKFLVTPKRKDLYLNKQIIKTREEFIWDTMYSITPPVEHKIGLETLYKIHKWRGEPLTIDYLSDGDYVTDCSNYAIVKETSDGKRYKPITVLPAEDIDCIYPVKDFKLKRK